MEEFKKKKMDAKLKQRELIQEKQRKMVARVAELEAEVSFATTDNIYIHVLDSHPSNFLSVHSGGAMGTVQGTPRIHGT